jgi:predicted P-loop ATPase
MSVDPDERVFFAGRVEINADGIVKKASPIDPATGADIGEPILTTFDDAKDAADAWGVQCTSPLVKYGAFCVRPPATTPTAPQPPAPPAPIAPSLTSSSYEPPAMPFGVIRLGWMRTDVKGSPIADEENVRLLLSNDPSLQGIAKYDEFAGDLILARPITSDAALVGERGTPRLWTDADTATLQTYIQQRHIPKIAREKIDSIVSMHAQQHYGFHPVRDYLQSLSWDGAPRLNTWLTVYLGADSQPADYLAAVGPAWLISAVARIFKPGCQADCALVLEGSQGIRKSTALRVLSGDAYFSDSLPADLAHKDARDHLRGKWIIELSELAQFKRAEMETVKAFISRRYEQYRPSYGRHEVKFPRQCVFAGSTNDSEYLVDTTGNRRFWVVSCTRVDLAALTRDRDQLWAEAAARFREGEPWHLVGVLEEMAAAQAAERIAHDPWTAKVVEIIAERITTPEASPGEVMEYMGLHEHERHARNAGRVGQILKNIGWRKGTRHKTRGQLYARPAVPLPPGVAPAPPPPG